MAAINSEVAIGLLMKGLEMLTGQSFPREFWVRLKLPQQPLQSAHGRQVAGDIGCSW